MAPEEKTQAEAEPQAETSEETPANPVTTENGEAGVSVEPPAIESTEAPAVSESAEISESTEPAAPTPPAEAAATESSTAAPVEASEPAQTAEPGRPAAPAPTPEVTASESSPEPRPSGEETAEDEMSQAELEALIEEYSSDDVAPYTGEIRQATVANFTADGVVVGLGLKSEGVVPLVEFTDDEGKPTIEPGASIEVLLEGSQAKEGYIPCSSEGAHRLRLWEEVHNAFREERKVRCKVMGRVKGGYEVEINLTGAHSGRRPLSAFLPGSHVDLKPVRHWEGFMGRELECRILKLNRRRGNILVSRRQLMEEEQAQRKKLLDEVLKEGLVTNGTVKNITNYGAFVDLGGVDGLLHVTDISYRRLGHPSEAVQPGDEIQVKVLKIDKEKQRISLGMKQLEPNPWEDAERRYKMGERVRGTVSKLMDYGAFIELEPGVEGLIHISEMSWTKRVRHPKDVLKIGDWVEAAVLDLQKREKRISLGLRQTQPDPFQTASIRYPEGSVVKGKVRSLTDFGAFIELESGVEGLVHKSELTWDKKPKRPSEVLKRGQEVEVKVLKVDTAARRLSLSLKDLQPDPWATHVRELAANQKVKGKVVRRAGFGLFVELAPGVEGLCHTSEIPEDETEPVEVGKEYEFRILKLNAAERRISLSLKAESERRAFEQYRAGQPRSAATLGEILSAKQQRAGIGKS
jgi:small subunit ribosomal protein S1